MKQDFCTVLYLLCYSTVKPADIYSKCKECSNLRKHIEICGMHQTVEANAKRYKII